MSIFLIRYLLAEGIRPGEIQRGLMSIFLIKYLLKAQGRTPGDPKRTYAYIPY